ncbi:adenosine deaminase/editase [Infundibulicybe gibba]|nr:adenosine deaminase/editase [Infundibulicybe gibba]
MSCSDKIAAWNVLGFQGALASLLLSPLHITGIIIGEVPSHMQGMVKEDCERALWGRLCQNEPDWPCGYSLHKPKICFTRLNFKHSRTAVTSTSVVNGSCNESLCWTADAVRPTEILINGLKRGVSPKHRYRDNVKPQISKIALFQQCNRMLGCGSGFPDKMSYHEAKATALGYQRVKQVLHRDSVFSGWVKSAPGREEFLVNGECRKEA